MRALPLLTTCLLTSLFLAGCGGGGGGGGSDAAAPAPAPVAPDAPVSLSGVITATERQYIDGDPNDPVATLVANNSRATAQPIANPSTVGGYVTQSPTNVPGDRFASQSDVNDYYQTDLVPGQTLTLEITDQADLDLFIEDNNGNVVDQSVLGGNSPDSIDFNGAAGRYFVRVFAFSGRSNYLLRIGSGFGSAAAPQPWEQDIVEGELIVRFEDSAAAANAPKGPLAQQSRDPNMAALSIADGQPGTERLVKVDMAAVSASQAPENGDDPVLALRKHFATEAAFQTWLAMKRTALSPQVASVEMNRRVRAQLTPNDPFYSRQWHYPAIALPQAWDTTQGSASTIIAIVDTGILSGHPDLMPKLTGTGYDFVSSAASAGDGNGIDSNPEEPRDPDGVANVYHGSHVAGTAAASSNDGTGAAGVDWNARIMPIRVLGLDGGGTNFDVLQGVRYAAGLPNNSGIVLNAAQRADIINLSLGSGGTCAGTPTADLFQQISNSGVIVVAAAGNERSSAPNSPAACPGVFSVSATRLDGTLAPYSNFGNTIDLAAPGGDTQLDQDNDGFADGILSSWFNDAELRFGLRYLNGTSMASPHAAGVFGLMKAVDPSITPAEVENLLVSGRLTRDLGTPGRDNLYGYGLIDAAQAVASAAAGAQPFLRLEPQRLDFTQSGSLDVVLSEPTGESNQMSVTAVDNVSGAADWLSVMPAATDGTGLGTYRVTVNTDVLSNEAVTYNGRVTFSTDNGLNIELPVSLRIVGPTDLSSNVGVQFVLLVDADEAADNEEVTALFQDVAGSVDGEYGYAFSDIPPGRYLLFTGSDTDNDGFICDAGESCGGFPTEAEAAPIVVVSGSDQNGLDFGTGFISAPLAASSADGKPARGIRLLNPNQNKPDQGKQLQQ